MHTAAGAQVFAESAQRIAYTLVYASEKVGKILTLSYTKSPLALKRPTIAAMHTRACFFMHGMRAGVTHFLS